MRCTFLSLLTICVLVIPAPAKPVLVAVELPDRAQQGSWHRLGVPTYEFLGTTAIAEVEESQLRGLAGAGYQLEIIDDATGGGDYLLVDREACIELVPSTRVIWERGNTQLLQVPTDQLRKAWHACKECRLLNRTPLPERFWDGQLAQTVLVASVPWDADIQALVDEVDTDTLTAHIQRLQNFVARFALTDSSYAASEWLLRYFQGLGYPAAFDSFYIEIGYPQDHPGWERNVVATRAGMLVPSRRFIIGGHFDANSSDPDSAPGADDNASGVACVMEAARILSSHGADYSLDFVCWAAEERAADTGSDHQAAQATNQGWDLGGVVVLDMIGYMNDDLLDCQVRSETAPSHPLAQLFVEAASTYVPSLLTLRVENTGSDASPFSYLGYPAILAIEHGPSNPNYHSPEDVWTTLSPELYTTITKAAIATMVVLGRSPRVVEDVTVTDVGDGARLDILWAPCADPDAIGYTVGWGLASGVYIDSLYIPGVNDTMCVLTGLVDATTYYIAVRAVDSDGYRSWGVTEAIGVPRVTPLPPEGVAATPVSEGIRLSWNAGHEQDLAGYRILRRVNDEATYDTLTAALVIDTTFVDAPLNANLYRYVVRAVDQTGNASPPSIEVWARPITLDQGILLVDETRDDLGPPDSLQDGFYHAILSGYAIHDFDFTTPSGRPLLRDLGQYSTVIWHADDYYTFLASSCLSDLEAYLDAGGNLWFMGWKPSANLEGNASYPKDFLPGSFPYEYLKVSGSVLTPSSAGIDGVYGLGGYPDIGVDSVKVPQANWGGAMRYFEALTAADPGDSVFQLDMRDDTSPYDGAVCGVRYLGSDYRTVYLGFPLYFMNQDQARLLAQQVMADFGELGGDWPHDSSHPLALHLSQNAPNPFGGQTTIRYWLPSDGVVHLGIYDIGGRLVRMLVDGPQERGRYSIAWDGTDAQGAPAGSGVYVCGLRVGSEHTARRMLVVR